LLIPEKKDDKITLICKSCGYEKPASEAKGYKIVQPVDETKRRKTLVVEGKEVKGGKRKEEEHELIKDNYEVFNDTGSEEGEDEESSEENDFE
jgi:DNA-directed RNA polymerase subunit M/transcription elongation factor TFIIS